MSVNGSSRDMEMEEFVFFQISELNWIHTKGMIPIGQELAQQMGANEAVVYYAIFFHDVAKDQSPDHHASVGARTCNNFLRLRRDLPTDFIHQVVYCVATHDWAWKEGDPPETNEARIVFDADMLQQLSQTGVVKHLGFKYENLTSLYARIGRTKKDFRKAANSVLTSAGRQMVATRKKKVDDILNGILQGE